MPCDRSARDDPVHPEVEPLRNGLCIGCKGLAWGCPMKRTVYVLWPWKKGVWTVGVTDRRGAYAAHMTLYVQMTTFPRKFRGAGRHKGLRHIVENEMEKPL